MITNFLKASSVAPDVIAQSVLDDGSIELFSGKVGNGFVIAGDNDEFAHFEFGSDDIVTLISTSANVDNSDTDGKLCIYDNGTAVTFKNRLGSTKIIRAWLNYL